MRHPFTRSAPPRRRVLIQLAAALALLPGLARGGEGGGHGGGKGGGAEDPEAARKVLLPPMLLPGRDRMSFLRLEVRLVVKKNKDLTANIEKVNDLKPRIVSALMVELTEHHVAHNNLSEEDIRTLKEQIIESANEALDAKLIEDVLIVSLITG